MKWTLGKYVGATDHLELLTVTALPRLSAPSFSLAPLPARQHVPVNLMDHQVEENRHKSMRAATHLLDKYIELAIAAGVPRENVTTKVLTMPAAGVSADKVGHVLTDYINESHPDITVIGSRGMGAFRRKLGGMFGLGSVSDYLIHHATSPVMVVKLAEDDHHDHHHHHDHRHHKHRHRTSHTGSTGGGDSRISSDGSDGDHSAASAEGQIIVSPPSP